MCLRNLVLRCSEFFHFWFPVLPQSSSRILCKKRPKLNVAGELARRSPLLCIHRKTFFFLFLKCFTSAVTVPVLVQVSPWSMPTVFFTCVPVGQSILWSLPLTSQFDWRVLLPVTLLVLLHAAYSSPRTTISCCALQRYNPPPFCPWASCRYHPFSKSGRWSSQKKRFFRWGWQ